MLRTRLITAAIVLPALVFGVLKAEEQHFTLFLAVVAAIGVLELLLMYRASRAMTAVAAALGALCIMAYPRGMFGEALLLSMMVLGMLRMFTKPSPEGALRDMAPAMLGLLYVAGLLSYQLVLHKAHHGLVLYLLGTVWISDASAYLVGTKFGRHRLYPSMSPKKTWEGAAASMAGGVLGSFVLGSIFLGMGDRALLVFPELLTAGLAMGAVAVMGDLFESMIKRDAGVKDSASFIPGHGGLLDKLDGPLFAGPVLVYILTAYGVIADSITIKLPF